ncbi:M20/M25/M40 family metallo-hydrolase [Dinghuibacter silviterrae]|uniref:Carboxypeptidase Q n=1 Tax=Dinghuibacter silviterrae TaxID=1539049 RepID=A0A4R8DUH4_9BACT|nr:M20/M25/M40 family metallo-hydrolase [Dinghuibacter silviterrae]TDX01819.1 peptidase M28-like protein [Dinghuibacter silviterrae]
MKQYLVVLLILSCASVRSQDTPDSAIVARIKTEAFEHSRVMEFAFHLTDASGPRLTNSPGLYRAQQWVLATLRSWGLSNVDLEPWGTFGKGWEVTRDYLAMTEPYYQPLIAYPVAWSKGTGWPFTAEVALYHPKDSAEQAALRGTLRGKLVLYPSSASIQFPFEADAKRYSDSELASIVTPPQPIPPRPSIVNRRPSPQPTVRRPVMVSPNIFFQQEGVIGSLTSNVRDRDGTVYVQGTSSYRWEDSLKPMRLELSFEGYHQLQRLLEDGIQVKLEGDMETRYVTKDSIAYNVIGEIPGVDPLLKDQLVIIGGHLDSWQSATGATDNGAGSAVMLEVMRILTTLQIHPRRTIRIILWSGEEQGLLGSRGYVGRHFKSDSTARSKVSAYYNLDEGSGKIRGVYLQGDTAAGEVFKQWLEPFKELGASTITVQGTDGTDHLSFADVGIPGFQFIQDPLEYETRTHHSNMDTYDHLSPDDLKQASAIIATFVYQTAMRDGMIPRK